MRKIENLQKTMHVSEKMKEELLLMRRLEKKCELESLYTKGIFFAAEYFRNALQNKDYI